MLTANDLTIGYGSKQLCRDINVSLNKGELVCLIGLNGSGKSTLIRTLGGLTAPLYGSVTISEKDINTLSVRRRAQQVSMVLTDRFDVPYLTVEQFVAWSRNPYLGTLSRLTPQDNILIQESMQRTDTLDLAQRTLSTLSDGERSRVLVAAALCQDTEYILLDEPTAHLDVYNRHSLMSLAANISHTLNKGILISTHELDLARATADTLWVLDNHRLTINGELSIASLP